ncbi:hypothetical protein RclHR1_05730005 [Rhizophagus clarus]|uniref:SAM domain-containing protein n=1 Tax=Rhizophagus clarus TaxID=94130 RepID=A0A2Z6SGR8_9GLOM|nr:hypothetical protein RclHR1_05730005 [Rhizophagus clarus]
MVEYNIDYRIGSYYGCYKCMYCSCKFNEKEYLSLCRKAFIQAKKELYSYNINLKKKFTFTLCSICNNQYQKLSNNQKTEKITISENFDNSSFCDNNSIDPSIIDSQLENSNNTQPEVIIIDYQSNNNYKKNKEIQEISFTLIVKKVDRKLLPGKWLTLNISTFKEFAIQIQQFIGIIVGVENIDQKEYSLSFKSAKSNDGGLELSDSKDFEKFRNEYEKLFRLQKEIVVIAQIRHKEKVLTSDESTDENNDNLKKRKVNAVPKAECILNGTATLEIAPTLSGFAAQHATKRSILAQSQQMFAGYPIQYALPQYIPPSYYPPYMTSETCIPPTSNTNRSLLSEIPVPSVEEFLKKLDKDEVMSGVLITRFNEQKITVKHIKDLDDNEFQMLGVKIIGWHKTIRTAAKQY